MTVGIVNIIGIDKEIANVLRKVSITTVKRLYEATRTAADREELAKTTGYSLELIEKWAVQAELLRNTNMSPEDALEFIKAGIYTVEEINKQPAVDLLRKVKLSNRNSLLSLEQVVNLQQSRIRKAKSLDIDREHIEHIVHKPIADGKQEQTSDSSKTEDPISSNPNTSRRTSSNIYSDLSEVISEIGRGIAEAQYQLDRQSLELQKEILNTPELSAMGLTATWYAMPEVDFELKMEYTITENSTITKNIKGEKIPRKDIKILPHNATYNNFFNSVRTDESTLRLKFVPVPSPIQKLEASIVPNMIGMTKEEAEKTLMEYQIENYEFTHEDSASDREKGTVIAQSIEPSENCYSYEKLTITLQG